MKYGVWCEVYNGVTGHRVAWLKNDGNIATFDTVDEAASVAAHYNERQNGNPYRTASYSYEARVYR